MPWVLGLDVCPGGWAAVAWDGNRSLGAFGADVGTALAEVDRCVPGGVAGLAVVGIDIPIGLPDASVRAADVLARRAVGRLASSVFTTPIRSAVLEPDYRVALARTREVLGVGLSRQAHGLREKVLQVDSLVAGASAPTVREVHPEVSFAQMAGAPLGISKHRWGGVERRRALLAAQGIDLSADLGPLGRHAGVADVLDAAAVAWTAMRVATGRAHCLPDPPEVFSDGWPAAIWV